MVAKCKECKRNETQKRTLNEGNVCTECIERHIPEVDFANDKNISDVTFGEFKNWFKVQLKTELKDMVHLLVKKQLDETINKEVVALKTDNKNFKNCTLSSWECDSYVFTNEYFRMARTLFLI